MWGSDWSATGHKLDKFEVNATRSLTRDIGLFAGYTYRGDSPWDPYDQQAAIFRLIPGKLARVFDAPGYIQSLDIHGDAAWAVRGKVRADQTGSDYFAVHSADGGATWAETSAIAYPSIGQILAVGEHEAWVLGVDVLARTVDGGKTWTPIAAPGDRNSIEERLKLESNTVVLLLGQGVKATPDGGKSWIELEADGAQVYDLVGNLMVTKRGADIRFGALAIPAGTVEWGATLHDEKATPFQLRGPAPAHLAFLALDDGTGIGHGAFLYETKNAGKTFSRTKIPCRANAGAIDLSADGGGFAVDVHGRVLAPKR